MYLHGQQQQMLSSWNCSQQNLNVSMFQAIKNLLENFLVNNCNKCIEPIFSKP